MDVSIQRGVHVWKCYVMYQVNMYGFAAEEDSTKNFDDGYESIDSILSYVVNEVQQYI